MLNARFHEQEAFIIAQAGPPRAVTIATNMAGRGTDIQLGGNVDMQIEQQIADLPEAERESKRAELTRKSRLRPLPQRKSSWRPVGYTSSVRNVTKRAASTTSYAAAPDARAIPADPSSTCRLKTT